MCWRSGQEVSTEEGATPHWFSPSPSPVAPQGTQPHITRASPHLPATSQHSQPRHLACPPLPRTLRRAGWGEGGEGAAGQVPTPEPGGRDRSPSPKVLEDLRWDRGLWKGVAGALMLQEEASSIPN